MEPKHDIEEYPYVDLTIRAYLISGPEAKAFNHGSGFAYFRYSGTDWYADDNEGKHIGSEGGVIGGGHEICLETEDGFRVLHITPWELWNQAVIALGKQDELTTYDHQRHLREQKEREEIRKQEEELAQLQEEKQRDQLRLNVIDLLNYRMSSIKNLNLRTDLIPPDFSRHGYSKTGKNLVDIPEPHIRQWPTSNQKRDVRIHIARYYNIGQHYYVTIEKEFNPIWDGIDGCWRKCQDDNDGFDMAGGIDTGYDLKAQSYHEAKLWIDAMIDQYFPEDRYRILLENYTDMSDGEWFYKEGD
jgi:hypothetical protein